LDQGLRSARLSSLESRQQGQGLWRRAAAPLAGGSPARARLNGDGRGRAKPGEDLAEE